MVGQDHFLILLKRYSAVILFYISVYHVTFTRYRTNVSFYFIFPSILFFSSHLLGFLPSCPLLSPYIPILCMTHSISSYLCLFGFVQDSCSLHHDFLQLYYDIYTRPSLTTSAIRVVMKFHARGIFAEVQIYIYVYIYQREYENTHKEWGRSRGLHDLCFGGMACSTLLQMRMHID